MSECNHDYDSYSANCENCAIDKSGFLEALNPASSVEEVIGVVSRKGNVGKSLMTSMVAVSMNRKGKRAAVLGVDIIGPSIPMVFGPPNDGVMTSPDSKLMLPARSMEEVGIMSANLLLDKDTDPVIWRGPVVAGTVRQFWSETLWQDIDYMFVDMPPGTGNVLLTVFQSLPVDGIIIVTSPQELVNMVVAKAVNMAKKVDVPAVGVVGNINYLECPDYGKHISVFGGGHVEEVAREHGIWVLVQIPIDPRIAQMVGAERVEYMEMPWFEHATEVVEAL